MNVISENCFSIKTNCESVLLKALRWCRLIAASLCIIAVMMIFCFNFIQDALKLRYETMLEKQAVTEFYSKWKPNQFDMDEMLAFMKCTAHTWPSRKEKEKLLHLLLLLDKLLNRHNITYSAIGGNLLAVIRNHGHFIPYDDDVDIYVHNNSRPLLKRLLLDEFNNVQGGGGGHRRRGEFSQLRYVNTPSIVKVYFYEKNCYHPPGQQYCYPFVDVILYDSIGNETFHQPLSFIKFRADNVFPLERSTLDGVQLWTPGDWRHFVENSSLTNCCTNRSDHKRETCPGCNACLPGKCLHSWITFDPTLVDVNVHGLPKENLSQ